MTVRVLVTCLMAGAMCALTVPAAVSAQGAASAAVTPGKEAPVFKTGFHTVKNFYGQPDLSGTWSNASVTRLARPATYNGRLVMTETEVKGLESDRVSQVDQGNLPTDPSLTTQQVNATCDVKGFSGVGCGYNAGFTDPGNLVMRVNGQPRTSFITYPATGQVPAAKATAPTVGAQAAGEGDDAGPPAARGGAAAAGGRAGGGGGRGGGGGGGGRGGGGGGGGGLDPANNPERRALPERCLTSFGQSAGPVMTGQLYNNNYRITQGKDSVAIWVEMVHDVRIVRLDSKHRTDGVRPWWGDSIGHYEGSTLVVETTNYNPQNRIQGRSADDLVTTERFTKVAPDRLLYQFNVHSPANWDQDWGGEYEFAASPGIYEYACHEGNYALGDILKGNLDALNKAAAAPAASR